MSDNGYGTGLARRIRDWDDRVEEADGDSVDDARKPFDAGIMLAIATLFEAWDKEDHDYHRDSPVLAAMKGLRETAEAVVDE
ncbi:MAG TPA: hypothetical protein VN756_03180 [Solirubrobacterales bacterium]|nr:hypothetical protein [Solirubrobacterales bacterium]